MQNMLDVLCNDNLVNELALNGPRLSLEVKRYAV